MDSSDGFYTYNWFWNHSTGAAAAGGAVEEPVYCGVPTILVSAVVRDMSVTLSGSNFPAGETFKVTMSEFGATDADGIDAGTYVSGAGGEFNRTFTMPLELAGSDIIVIRLETEDGAFYAYNWFFNNTTDTE